MAAAELNFERLAALVAAQRVRILRTAPSVLARWNEVAECSLCRLRLVLSGGKALAWGAVDGVLAGEIEGVG